MHCCEGGGVAVRAVHCCEGGGIVGRAGALL